MFLFSFAEYFVGRRPTDTGSVHRSPHATNNFNNRKPLEQQFSGPGPIQPGAPYSTVAHSTNNTISYPLPPIGKSHYTDVQRIQHHNTVQRNFVVDQQEVEKRLEQERSEPLRSVTKKHVGFDTRNSISTRKRSVTKNSLRVKQIQDSNALRIRPVEYRSQSTSPTAISRAEELFVAAFDPSQRSINEQGHHRNQAQQLPQTLIPPYRRVPLQRSHSSPQLDVPQNLPAFQIPSDMSYYASPTNYDNYDNYGNPGYEASPYGGQSSSYDGYRQPYSSQYDSGNRYWPQCITQVSHIGRSMI